MLRRSVACERGTVTVEFIIFLPVFLILLAFTADACKLYIAQATMWDVARDTARRMSTGKICTVAAATAYAKSQMLFSKLTYTYTVTTGTDNTVQISTPIASASVFGILAVWGKFSGNTLSATVTMPAEPGVCS